MKRQSIALFLSTVALAGGAVACGKQPNHGANRENNDKKELNQPSKPAATSEEGGEGGEGGEG